MFRDPTFVGWREKAEADWSAGCAGCPTDTQTPWGMETETAHLHPTPAPPTVHCLCQSYTPLPLHWSANTKTGKYRTSRKGTSIKCGFQICFFVLLVCMCCVCILCKKWKNKEKGCVCVCVLYCKFCNRYYIAVVLCTPFSLAIQHSLCEGHSLIVPASRHRQWNSAHHSCWLSAPALTVFLRLFFTLNYTYDGLLTCGRYQWNSADHSCWSSSVQSVRAVVWTLRINAVILPPVIVVPTTVPFTASLQPDCNKLSSQNTKTR